ncbi:4-hydroxy-3-methylbut-2-enyl diphosphate reductase [Streptomyces sp. WZ.A104]|uniref:4-hydroxy-3-methylbut-2-enyl diphosphate reductase n=1 Tax=Streptomyces sp. WZ.A104 TaxID=2023771 RepID=UPI000BBB803A|nr:4-hydroxy-3-methylbut-2-enyl diphosphate reductase [Streptomyces sp. WZ.A104]PCG86539.1 4-hydroxy-3-methylbut-2-enyl diphosphate reductase [Streptomyces sp. WZ.A104]
MNRSKRSDVFSSTSLRIAPGALSVATTWRHPRRGWMDCPAHPLLSAHALRAGFAVATLPWPASGPGGRQEPAPPTTVFAVSYASPEGGHRGLAVAARSDEAAALAFARHQIESWGAVLRTRRVLHVSEAAAGDGGRLACGCPVGRDCPSAGYAERSLHRSADRGDEVVVVGEPVTGSGTWPRRMPAGQVMRAATLRQAEALWVRDPDRLAFVVAPGAVVSEAVGILGVLRRRFPRLRGQHPGEWCYTMDDLDTAVGSVLAQSDALLVTGRSGGPLASTALVRAARTGVRVRELTSLDRLGPQDIDGATVTVLDTAAPETGPGTVPDPGSGVDVGTGSGTGARQEGAPGSRSVGQILAGLGPASHIWRVVRTETVALPPPSRARTESRATV